MKKIYVLLTALLLVSSPMLALRLYVKNKTEDKVLYAWLPDDKSRGNFANRRKLEPNKERKFTTTLLKKIRGPLYFVEKNEYKKDKEDKQKNWFGVYKTPANVSFFPSSAVNRVVEIRKEIKKDGSIKYKIRKIPEDLWKLTGKKGKWFYMQKVKFRNRDWTKVRPWLPGRS